MPQWLSSDQIQVGDEEGGNEFFERNEGKKTGLQQIYKYMLQKGNENPTII